MVLTSKNLLTERLVFPLAAFSGKGGECCFAVVGGMGVTQNWFHRSVGYRECFVDLDVKLG